MAGEVKKSGKVIADVFLRRPGNAPGLGLAPNGPISLKALRYFHGWAASVHFSTLD